MTRAANRRCWVLAVCAACAPVDAPIADPAAAQSARAFFSTEELRNLLRASPVPALPSDPTNAVADDPDAAEFGQLLFYDERLSSDGSVACATCHDPGQGWSDGRAKGQGLAALDVHTPSLWNVAYNRWFFWDGRADSLWSQALQPLEEPMEHGGSRLQFAHLVAEDPALREAYERSFGALPELPAQREGRPVPGAPEHPHAVAWETLPEEQQRSVDRVFSNLGKSIAAFERQLVSAEAPFDRFVRGLDTGDADDLAALSSDAQAGAKLFFGKARCHLCHQGPLFTDMEFHDARIPGVTQAGRYEGIRRVLADPFNGLGPFSDDRGDEARTKLAYLLRSPHTRREFKTPGLRNVAASAPYMHGGQYANLGEVVDHYSTLEDAPRPTHADPEEVLVPLLLSAAEKEQLVDFLESLNSGPPDPRFSGPPSP